LAYRGRIVGEKTVVTTFVRLPLGMHLVLSTAAMCASGRLHGLPLFTFRIPASQRRDQHYGHCSCREGVRCFHSYLQFLHFTSRHTPRTILTIHFRASGLQGIASVRVAVLRRFPRSPASGFLPTTRMSAGALEIAELLAYAA
jgi:hypothetical protein